MLSEKCSITLLIILDLAESDINYTHGVMKHGVLPYAGKEVLILGGGDGGLLHELLKENPKFVTMVDISFNLCFYLICF